MHPLHVFATPRAGTVHAPQLAAIESLHAIRRRFLTGDIDAERGRRQLRDLAGLPYERHEHDLLLDRIWELRGNLRPRYRTRSPVASRLAQLNRL